MFAEAFVEGGKAFRAQKNTANENSGTKYSIRTSKEGTQFVEVENQTISQNDTEKDIANILSDIVKNKFNDFVNVKGQKIGINKRTVKEWIRSKDAQYLYANKEQKYTDKLNSFNNADELLKASRDYIGEETKHYRKDNFVEFARGVVDFRVGNNGYSADIIVGTTKSNVAILYDIVNLQSKKIEDTSHTAQDRRAEASSTTTIPQNAQGVNSNSMQNGENNSEKFSSRYYDDIDVDEFDIKDYTKLKLTKRDHKVFYSEAITWDADKVGQICKKNLGAYTYVYSVNSDHTLTLLGKRKYTNIHEREEYKQNAIRNREVFDKVLSELESKRRDDRHSADISRNGRTARANDKLSNQEARAERRSNGTGYTESGNNADSREEDEEVKFSSRDSEYLELAKEPETDIEKYTQKQYNDFGWVRANNALSEKEYFALMSRFADVKANKFREVKNKKGEYVIPIQFDEDKTAAIVYIKGTMANPIIREVVRLLDYDYIYFVDEVIHLETNSYTGNAIAISETYADARIFSEHTLLDYSSYSELRLEQRQRNSGRTNRLNRERDFGDEVQGDNREGLRSEDNSVTKNQTRNTDGLDNRTLLANALETVAQNDVEREYLATYKEITHEINEKQEQLGEYRRQIKNWLYHRKHSISINFLLSQKNKSRINLSYFFISTFIEFAYAI